MLLPHFLTCTVVVLLALSSPLLAATESRVQCRGHVLSNQELDIPVSRKNNAVIETVGAAHVSSAQQCADKCCEDASGNCTVGQYSTVFNSNCLLLNCHPLSACIFSPSDSIFLGVAEREETTTTTITKTDRFTTEAAAAAGGFSDGTSSPKYSSNASDVSPLVATNESTTAIDPNRNETSSSLAKEEASVVGLSNATAPKGSAQNDSTIGGAQADTGKHDPPQTEPFSITVKSAETSTAHHETTSFVPPKFTTSTTTLLNTITKESTLDVDKSKGSKPRKGVVFDKVDGNAKLSKQLSASLSDTEVDSNPSKTVPPDHKEEEHAYTPLMPASEPSINVTSSPTTASVKEETDVPTTVLIDNSSGSPATQVPLSSSPSPSTSPPLPPPPPRPSASNSSKIPSTSTENSTPSRASSVPLTTLDSTGSPSFVVASSSVGVSGASDDEDIHATAKFHLVIALVLGLMLLITVVGLVLRRIYDIWQRRHYQRMDFLIDGLYNSVNT